jgi:signal transduction histidine kinase
VHPEADGARHCNNVYVEMAFPSSGPTEEATHETLPGSISLSGSLTARRRVLGLLLMTLALVALSLTGAVVELTRSEWVVRYQGPGQRLLWSRAEWAYFFAGWASVLLGQLAGLWLWWRAPRNATGRWLWLAGLALGLWFVGTYWPNPWGMQLAWAIYAMLPALAMAILGWPSGKPGRTVRRWIAGIAIASFAVAVLVDLVSRSDTPGSWPQDPVSRFSVSWVAPVVDGVTGWLFYSLPAVAVIVVLVRRRRGVPREARRLLTPITITGILVAGSTITTVVVNDFALNWTWDDARNHATLLGTVNFVQNYGQVAIAAVGLLISFAYRQRSVRAGDHELEFELARPMSGDTSSALARLLDDPSARVLYRRPGGAWVDVHGERAAMGQPHRTFTPVEDRRGSTLAAIETDSRIGAHPSLLEIAAATVATSLTNERVFALASAKTTELVALQSALLDATDATRRRLERDLHDGIQQRLVGLTLAARLAARDGDRAAVESIRAEIAATRFAMLEIVDDRLPMVLYSGLASALMTLAATAPLEVEVHVRGDLEPSDPLARTLWLIASEAIANAIKHAHASTLLLDLAVDTSSAAVRVADDGCGGMSDPPKTIESRVREGGGEMTFSSPTGGGTDLVVMFNRSRTLAA